MAEIAESEKRINVERTKPKETIIEQALLDESDMSDEQETDKNSSGENEMLHAPVQKDCEDNSSINYDEAKSNSPYIENESNSPSRHEDETNSDSLHEDEAKNNSPLHDEEINDDSLLHDDEVTNDSLYDADIRKNLPHEADAANDSLDELETSNDSLHEAETTKDSLAEVETVDDSLQEAETTNDSLHETETINDSLQETETADSLHETETKDSLHEVETVNDSLHKAETTNDSLHEAETISDLLHETEATNDSLHDVETTDDSLILHEDSHKSISLPSEDETRSVSPLHGDESINVSQTCEEEKLNILPLHEVDKRNISPLHKDEATNITSLHEDESDLNMPCENENIVSSSSRAGRSFIAENNSSNLPETECSEEKYSHLKVSKSEVITKSTLLVRNDIMTEPKKDLSNVDMSLKKSDSVEKEKHTALIHEEMLISLSDDEDESCQQSPLVVETESEIKTEPTDHAIASESISEGDCNDRMKGKETSDVQIKMEVDSPRLQLASLNSLMTKSNKAKKKKEPSNIKKNQISRSITVGDPDVPEGWQRLVVQRQGGASAGKYDVYYHSPLGKKLRSRNDVISYCERNGIEIDMTKFKFTHGPPRSMNAASSSTPKVVKQTDGVSKKRKIQVTDPEHTPEGSLPAKRIKLSPNMMGKKLKPASPAKQAKSTPKTDQKENGKKSSHFKAISIIPARLKLKGKKNWMPPKSPYNLYQESLYHDPWQLLIGTIFLNKTSGEDVLGRNTLWEFLERWPTPENLLAADQDDIVDVIKPLGLFEKRVKLLFQFTEDYLHKSWTYPKELHGIGKYGNDCYRIFCVNEWRKVKPTDYLLTFYVEWLWDNHKFLALD